jgi:hypothetical protein
MTYHNLRIGESVENAIDAKSECVHSYTEREAIFERTAVW